MTAVYETTQAYTPSAVFRVGGGNFMEKRLTDMFCSSSEASELLFRALVQLLVIPSVSGVVRAERDFINKFFNPLPYKM